MNNIVELLKQPWPWYVAGPIIGLTVPLLLLIGNKSFGISSSLRHICASCMPANIPFFKYDWRKEVWNLFFVVGILIGGYIAGQGLSSPSEVDIHPDLKSELAQSNIVDYSNLVPHDIINWNNLLTLQGFILMILGGFLIGFGTRYAGGCTSGHAIMGLSTLQWPSLVATICFMLGGFLTAHFIVPVILKI